MKYFVNLLMIRMKIRNFEDKSVQLELVYSAIPVNIYLFK